MKKVGKILLWVCAILALVVVAIWYFVIDAPERALNANVVIGKVRSQTTQWDTRVNLLGTVVDNNMARLEFETLMINAGFELDDKFAFYFKDDELKPNEVVWSREQHSLVCHIKWSVITSFNEENKVLTADGVGAAQACL